MSGARCAACLLVAILTPTVLSGGTPTHFEGLSLADALRKLSSEGLRVIYSTDLVRPDMKVTEEPRGRWPQEILDELLAPHGLSWVPGPVGSRLVVKARPPGFIEGVVRVAGSTTPVAGVRVSAAGTGVEAVTDARGRFSAGPLPEGKYSLTVDLPGYRSKVLKRVAVKPGQATRIRVALDSRYAATEEVVVEGTGAASNRDRPEVRQSLNRDQILRSPDFASDPLLPVGRLAGVATDEGSGSLFVRGGSSDEVKIVLDGLELYEPFHLRDRGGLIGIIDSRDVGQLDFLGGAFPSEYGGHMGGIVELHSTAPPDSLQTGLAASSDVARFTNQGGWGEQGSWMVSARSGRPARVLDALDADPNYKPRYYDLFGKVGYGLNNTTHLTFNVLGSHDTFEDAEGALVETIAEPGTFKSDYTNQYAWVSLKRAWSPRLYSRTILSQGRLASSRYGSNPHVAEVGDERSAGVIGLKQDGLFRSESHLLKWGVDLKRLSADYDYRSTGSGERPDALDRRITQQPQGGDYGLYVADRIRIDASLDVEVGLRWDVQTYAGRNDGALSPRVNLVYRPDPRSTLRVGWGHFYQPQRIHELQVQDGVDRFFPAQRAEHRLVAFERELDGRLRLKLELYQKRMTDLRPRFENLFDPDGFFPEAHLDRVRIAPSEARAEGIELTVRGSTTDRFSWWTGYALARAEDRIDGSWVPRAWDQRHTLDFGLNFRTDSTWTFGLGGTYHSGRPTTAILFEPEPALGTRNGERFPVYLRLDARISRAFALRGTTLTGFVNVTNVTDHRNPCCVDRLAPRIGAPPVYRYGFPRMFTYGLSWIF